MGLPGSPPQTQPQNCVYGREFNRVVSGCKKDGSCCFFSCVTKRQSPCVALYAPPVLASDSGLSCTTGGHTQPRPWLLPTPGWARGPHSRTGSTDRVLSSHLGQPGLVSAACICQHRGSLLVARCAALATSTSRGTQREGWPVVRKQGTAPGPSWLPAVLVAVTPPRGLPRSLPKERTGEGSGAEYKH